MRVRSVSVFVTALVGLAAPARASVEDGLLGSKCALDADCVEGLKCVIAGPNFTSAPAGGLCSAPCETNDDCKVYGEKAVCAGYCTEGCVTNTPSGQTLDPAKCHGRDDMACVPFDCAVPGTDACIVTIDACQPMCAVDAQCGEGFQCNHGANSLCRAEPPAGDPPGTPCFYNTSRDTCAGLCDLDPDEALRTGSDRAGLCTEPCVRGSPLACTGPGGGGRPRACVGAYVGYVTVTGAGDVGKCVDLCNCSSECKENEFCEPRDLAGQFEFAGICTRGARQPGVPDCLGAECDQGAVRACKVGDCLGTAQCLPEGKFSECECTDAGAPPTPGGGTPSAEPDDSGCSIARGASSGAACAWLVLLASGALRRRCRRHRERSEPAMSEANRVGELEGR